MCLAVGCKSNESPPAPPGNAVLEIRTLYPRGNDAWLAPRAPDPDQAGDEGYAGDPLPIVIGCDRRLGVDVELEVFQLRAPDACGGNVQCGTLVIEVDPSDSGAAASGRAAAPSLYLDLGPLDRAGKLEGDHIIRPRLEKADGGPYNHPFAFPPADIDVTFASDDCSTAAGGAGGAENGAGGAGNEAPGGGGAPAAP
jgi:hypothetical protein